MYENRIAYVKTAGIVLFRPICCINKSPFIHLEDSDTHSTGSLVFETLAVWWKTSSIKGVVVVAAVADTAAMWGSTRINRPVHADDRAGCACQTPTDAMTGYGGDHE